MTQVINRVQRQVVAIFATLMLLAGISVASTINAPGATGVTGSTATIANSVPAGFPYAVSNYSLKVTKTNGSVVWMKRGQQVTNVKTVCNTHKATRKLMLYTGVSRDGTGWVRVGACHTPEKRGVFRYLLIA